MENRISEKERLNELKRLKNSYAMYERAKKESIEKRKNMKDQYGNKKYSDNSIESTIEIMENMQNDILEQYLKYGGSKEDLLSEDVEYGSYDSVEDVNDVVNETTNSQHNIKVGDGVMDYLAKMSAKNESDSTESNVKNKMKPELFDTDKIKEQFDIIPLPSKGKPYQNKIDKLPIGFLTAYDENIIVSPNLYKDGTFIDYLLKAKILNPAIDAGDLLPGDRDAIILWLRATGYGNEFPVTVTDDETGREFSTVVDLSKIQFKDFNLESDENGWFTYTLPVSKDEIKFNFLSYNEQKELFEQEKSDDMGIKREEIKTISDRLILFKKDDIAKNLNKQFVKRIDEAIKMLDEWYYKIPEENKYGITHTLTNKMIKMIKSINGVTDRKFIREYVVKMNIKDASTFRKYVLDNEPGLDYTIEVERPESLGGGSMTTFLTLDQYIFLNIA